MTISPTQTSAAAAPDPIAGLALAIHRGEPGAFERAVGTFEKPLFNYVQRMLRNVADAEEVVQDTFLRAHRSLTEKYTEAQCSELALRPWIFRIARNLTSNKRRGKRFEVEVQLSEDAGSAATVPGVSIVCRVELKDDLGRLEEALYRLPASDRELILLRFMEEMSYREIAEMLGSSEASLRGRVFRAVRSLRTLLEGETDEL